MKSLLDPVVRRPLAHPKERLGIPPSPVTPSASSVFSAIQCPNGNWPRTRTACCLDRPLVCLDLCHVIRELGQISDDAPAVYLHLSSRVPLVDHTTG